MKKLALIMIVMSGCLLTNGTVAQGTKSKYEALFIYNFTKYMKWPDKDKIAIGVMGNSPVYSELEAIAKRGSKISLVKVSGADAIAQCDMIFLPQSESSNFQMVQKGIGPKNIIIVAENDKLTNKGAEVGFFLDRGKLKFAINKKELEATEVLVSQGLYSMATIR